MLTLKDAIKIIECPRDAMQGLDYFIATQDKINYLNLLLRAGFDTLDFGSFVSPKAIPQMADIAEVLEGLDLSNTKTKLLAIVANLRGAEDAFKHSSIKCLGYPFSISETFQKRNTNTDLRTSITTVKKIVDLCTEHNKEAVIYLSMAFGNPYGDKWSEGKVLRWCEELVKSGVGTIALSDTTGISTAQSVTTLFKAITKNFPSIEVGVHLHSQPNNWTEKIEAAYISGCRRFDAALKGYGGCPMAADTLTGNIATENLVGYLSRQNETLNLNNAYLDAAMKFAATIFR